jgi:hypothetical protein
MPVIRVDEEVYEAIGSLARPFIDKPNDVLRRVLGLVDNHSKNDESPAAPNLREEKGEYKMSNIRSAGWKWFERELDNPDSIVSQFLKSKNQYNLGKPIYKRNSAFSSYYSAEISYPKIPVWWLKVPDHKLREEPCLFFFLICQKGKGNYLDFNLLAVDKSYLLDKSSCLKKLGDGRSLELSTEPNVYKEYKIAKFDDVCCTRNSNVEPVPFGQFDLGYYAGIERRLNDGKNNNNNWG